MALIDKLRAKTQEINSTKEVKKKAAENKELEPIRANIIKLEAEKTNLEMIKNSLDFNNQNPQDGLGMKEYAKQVSNEKTETKQQIEDTVKKISDDSGVSLEELEISNVDDIADNIAGNEKYSEDKEVVAYKKAISQESGLQISDKELKKRLVDLGIEVDDNNFSYQSASQEIGLRLADLEKELLTDKLKTPEGKEEIINKLAEEFSQNTKNFVFDASVKKTNNKNQADFRGGEEDAFYKFGFKDKVDDYSRDKLIFKFYGDKTVFENFRYFEFLPHNFKEQADKYGLDIASEALKNAYKQKMENTLTDPNERLGGAIKMRTLIESGNPEKQKQVVEVLEKFQSKKEDLLKLLKEKSKELEGDFSGEHASGYGGEYVDLFKFSYYQDAEELINNIKSNSELLPKYDFEKITAIAKRRTDELNQAMEVIDKIKNEDDVMNFLYNKKSKNYIGQFHQQTLDNRFEDEARFKLPEEIGRGKIEELSKQFSSYNEAVQYLETEISDLTKDKERIVKKLSELVEYKVAEKELYRNHKDITNLDRLESMIKEIEGERKSAQLALKVIINLEFKLPANEDVVVKGVKVEIHSKEKESEKLSEDREGKEKELKEKEDELKLKESKKPFFGKAKWQDQISDLKTEIETIKTEIQNLSEKYKQAIKDRFYYLDADDLPYSKSKRLIENYSNAGKAEEVFNTLKEQLSELSKQEISTDLQEYYDKLKNLKDSLTGKT